MQAQVHLQRAGSGTGSGVLAGCSYSFKAPGSGAVARAGAGARADADTGTDGGADARAEPKVHKSFFCDHTFSLPGPRAIYYVTSVYPVFLPCSP